jgi:hypothetical protein
VDEKMFHATLSLALGGHESPLNASTTFIPGGGVVVETPSTH